MTRSDPQAQFRTAAAAHRAGDLHAAEAGYRRVLALAPQAAPALHNLALILREQRREADLVPVYKALLDVEPSDDLHWRLATLLLALGRYTEAWPHYERRPRKVPPQTSIPEWRGEPLQGKSLLVWHDEGFGDQIMMARLLARLQAERVTWAVMPPLLRLFSQLCPTVSRIGRIEGRFDFWVPAMSLPARLAIALEDLPPPPPLAAEPRRDVAGRIGIMGSCDARQGTPRNLPADLIAWLLAMPGAMSLEPADTGARDFQDTAEILAALELVITVDTATAHLAGALGKPTWILLPTPSDWRWGRDPERSPWYPTARLWRQGKAGDWAAVVERIVMDTRT
jgi:hypothetical protein